MTPYEALRAFYWTHARPFFYSRILRPVPDRVFCSAAYFAKFGHRPNLARPKTFNELLTARKLTCRDPLLAITTDKLRLKQYVNEKLDDSHSADVLRTADTPGELTLEGLNPPYVVKATHGCGTNLIVHDTSPRLEDVRRLASNWCRQNFYWYRREWPYLCVEPRVFVEEYLGSGGVVPFDYKIFVFSGHPRMIEVDVGRFVEHRRALMTPDWRLLDVAYHVPRPSEAPPRPDNLDDMLEIARKIGRDFEFVRVDLFSLQDRIIVGELTHFPQAAMGAFDPPAFDEELAGVWLENREISSRWALPRPSLE